MARPGHIEMTAGWHGKLPTLGDFATRRLDAALVQAWDDWLSMGLATLQRQPRWLDAYLASPSWRFLLMPGVLPAAASSHAWAGVLMPSVDRVGRYFPLTLMQALPALPASAAAFDALWRWLVRLDEAAADALHDDWTLDALEAELERIGPAPGAIALPDGSQAVIEDMPVSALPIGAHGHASALFAAQAAATWQRQWHGRAFWYADAGLDTPRLLASRGLETHALLPRLLGGVTDNPA
jgi:type VI secretion system protein ImpM